MSTGFIICTTPRSGSTLLCTLLEATGQAGQPDSFYHASHIMQEWADTWALPAPGTMASTAYDTAYLRAVNAAGRGVTARFGMRLQHEYLAPLLATLAELYPAAATDAARLAQAFGSLRYVHLSRTDKVAQAVSLVKARQSGLWHRNADGSERERTAPAAAPVYDAAAIAAEIATLSAADRAWQGWFAQERIAPFAITYEDFAPRPEATIQALCTLLGGEAPDAATIRPGVARLADRINREWAARYRAERGDPR